MISEIRSDDGWLLEESTTADVDELMTWFPEADAVMIWGGPSFRHPFTRSTFFEDIYWGRLESFSLRDPSAMLAAFGQLYDRDGRVHLARLVVKPTMRGEGIGKRLINMLMTAGQSRVPGDEFSLFVFRDNMPAYECYKSMGFVVSDYPDDMPHADVCYYLIKRSQSWSKQEGEENDE